jgi:hypothetical protein
MESRSTILSLWPSIIPGITKAIEESRDVNDDAAPLSWFKIVRSGEAR